MQHGYHRAPVTALTFHHGFILAGEGPSLRIYHSKCEHSLVISLDVFKDQAIHGIAAVSSNSPIVLVWGGSFITTATLNFLQLDSVEPTVELGTTLDAEDWILDVAVFHNAEADCSKAAVVTAHNALHTTKQHADGSLELAPLVTGSNCILYAAHVTWLSASQCLIASGTAFGDVLIWSCFIDQDGKVESPLHYRFTAHEGSVFGVHVSPFLELAGKERRLVATCSDDRSIKLWDITERPIIDATDSSTKHRTGFCGSSEDHDHAPGFLAEALGHVSRIWSVRFLNSNDDSSWRLLSFGEDASMIAWRLTANPAREMDLSSPFVLERLVVRTLQAGKHIWSTAIRENILLATGGADGAITLSSVQEESSSTPLAYNSPIDGQWHDGDFVRVYNFLDTETLLLTTDLGWVYKISMVDHIWIAVMHIPELRGYSVITSVNGVAFVAGASEYVYAFSTNDAAYNIACCGGKVASLFCAVAKHQGQQSLTLLRTTVSSGTASLYRWNVTGDRPVSDVFKWPAEVLDLRLPPSFVVTSYCDTGDLLRDDGRLVLLGARSGSVAAFISKFDMETKEWTASLLVEILGVHGKEAVTHLVWKARSCPGKGHLFSTGRDGSYAVHAINKDTDTNKMVVLVHKTALPFGPNAEGLIITDNGNTLLVSGFRSKHFVLYDAIAEKDVMSVECGGAHRQWAFSPVRMGGVLVWTQASKLHVHKQIEVPVQVVNSGGHGREIKALAISRHAPCLIATGAEDTNIKISVYSRGGSRCLRTLRKHTTGLQHLQWSNCGRYLYSSGGLEELFIWRVREVPVLGIGVVCESQMPTTTGGRSDLRVMNFRGSTEEQVGGVRHAIWAVFSDSTVRHWTYVKGHWHLRATGVYYTACLTQITLLNGIEWDRGGLGSTQMLTAGTDGHLTFWPTRDVLGESGSFSEPINIEWTVRHKVHQSAILSMLSVVLSDGSALIITGGDDNAIGFSRVTATEDTSATLVIPRAHAAAVTALTKISRGSANSFNVISAGLDQRVKVWHVDIEVGKDRVDGLEVRRMQNSFTPVADVSRIETFGRSDEGMGVVICGVGMDMWRTQ